MSKNCDKAEFALNNHREKCKPESKVRSVNINQTSNSNYLPTFKKEIDRDYFHWGTTAEIMEIIRRRRKSPGTLRLVERRLEILRQGTMRRKFDMNAQRQIWVPSRPNKRSREETAEVDGELLSRANKSGGGYQSRDDRIADEVDLDNINNNQQQAETVEEEKERDSESESENQKIQGDNFQIVDLKAYNTEG